MRSIKALVTSILVLLLLPGLTIGGALAQDSDDRTPSAGIHTGTCQAFDERAVHDLGEAEARPDTDPGALPTEDQPTITGFAGASPVSTVNTTIQALFDDLFTEDPFHSLVVSVGGDPVACGELGGVEDDGRIIVSLQPLEDSRFAGIGVFDEDDAGFLGLGEDEVNVTVWIMSLDGSSEDMEAQSPDPVEVEAQGEGFANEDWLVDSAWLDERLEQEIGEPIDEQSFAAIGVFPLEEQPGNMVPNTRIIEPGFLTPASTSEEDIDEWRRMLLVRVTSAGPALGDVGLLPDDTLVLYDDGSHDAMVLWWGLDYLGHDNKHVLEGGLDTWMEETEWETGAMPPGSTGQPVDPEQVPESLGDGLNENALATMSDVEAALEDENVVLVDVRSEDEYAAGHIPGAVNVPVDQNVGSDGHWADADELRQLYADAGVAPDARVITYGNDGTDAPVAYFTLGLLGYEDVAVYPGGWVEWSQFPELPREEGNGS